MEHNDLKKQLKIQLAVNKILKEQLEKVLEISDECISNCDVTGIYYDEYRNKIREVLDGK